MNSEKYFFQLGLEQISLNFLILIQFNLILTLSHTSLNQPITLRSVAASHRRLLSDSPLSSSLSLNCLRTYSSSAGGLLNSALYNGTLHRGVSHISRLHNVALHSSTLHRGTLHRGTLHRGTLHRGTLHRDTLHRSTLHRGTLHRGTLHRGTLHRGTLHRGTLHRGTIHRGINIALECSSILAHLSLRATSSQL